MAICETIRPATNAMNIDAVKKEPRYSLTPRSTSYARNVMTKIATIFWIRWLRLIWIKGNVNTRQN